MGGGKGPGYVEPTSTNPAVIVGPETPERTSKETQLSNDSTLHETEDGDVYNSDVVTEVYETLLPRL